MNMDWSNMMGFGATAWMRDSSLPEVRIMTSRGKRKTGKTRKNGCRMEPRHK